MNLIFEGNSIQNGAYSGGAYSYDECLNFAVPSSINNNDVTATPSTATCTIGASAGSTLIANNFNGASPVICSVASPCKIINNQLSGGTTYFITSTADCTINGNVMDTPGASSTFVKLTNCKCIVTNNRLTRGGTSISSYVEITGTSQHQITHNNFDSSTVNGTSETIISGLANGNIIDYNRNQTRYFSLFPTNAAYGHQWSSAVGSHVIGPVNFSSSSATLYYVDGEVATVSSAAGVPQKILFYVNLSRLLPKGAKVLSSLVGFRWHSIGANLSVSTFSISSGLHLTASSKSLTTDFASPASTLAAVSSSFPTFLDATLGAQSTSYAPDTTTKYLTGSYSSDNVYVNDTQDVIFRFQANVTLTASSATSVYHLSNFLFKYVLA